MRQIRSLVSLMNGLPIMITHVTHVYADQTTLDDALCRGELVASTAKARSVLVQIYSASNDTSELWEIIRLIKERLPSAAIVGATTVGEIAHGRLRTNQIVLGFTFFEASTVTILDTPCGNNSPMEQGAELGRRIRHDPGRIAGVLLLATPVTIDAPAFLRGLESVGCDYALFGGGAGAYSGQTQAFVFSENAFFDKGVIAVVLRGETLHLESWTYLGWRALSKLMTITEVEGLLVKCVDDQPAFNVYRRYLNIRNDGNFFLNALEFPFLIQRNGQALARVPVAVKADGALQFIADIREGECFRLGYGDMDLIINGANDIHQSMTHFAPEALWLYNCRCRRFLMQECVDLETLPYQRLAPTFGFYTNGEFFGNKSPELLNSTMVAVGLREGDAVTSVRGKTPLIIAERADGEGGIDPYANKHVRVISRLLRFIDAVTTELEASRRELIVTSVTDRLTQLVNRVRLDEVLKDNIQLALRYETPFSVLLIDIDHFKLVNDNLGHLTGDKVLIHLASLLEANTRSVDTVGRWGGEEFMVVAPRLGLGAARRLAEKLRQAIETECLPGAGRVTASIGVTCYIVGDDMDKMLERADYALYAAKYAGRNRVETRHRPVQGVCR